MRARDRDLPAGVGAARGLESGLVGIGDALARAPETLARAVAAATVEHGEKAGRMLQRFADLPRGTLVWTRGPNGAFHLGRIRGPWRYDDTPGARAVGIHHTRPTQWLGPSFGTDRVPVAVAAAFARGGRNLQRINDAAAKQQSEELWSTYAAEGDPPATNPPRESDRPPGVVGC
jgi:hypothetical protein